MLQRDRAQQEHQAWIIALRTKRGWRYKKWLESMKRSLRYQKCYYDMELARLEKEEKGESKNG